MPNARLGPIELAPGVLPRHALCYLWAAFVSIGIFTYITTLQPYILGVNLGIPPEKRGVISGDLQFWQEILALLVIGVIGAWSDKVGRRVVYVCGFLVTALAYAAYPFADDYGQLLIYRLIFAVGVATLGGMLATVLADYPMEKDRGKLTGIAFFLNALGAFIFFTVLNRLPAWFQQAGLSELWAGRAAYLFAAGVCLLSAVVMLGLRPGRPDKVDPRMPIRQLIVQGLGAGRQPRIALAYAASFTARADLVIVALFLALWAQNAAVADGFSAAEAARKQGILFAVVQGMALVWAPLFGWFADKVNRVTLVIIAIALSVIGYGWIGLVPDPLAPSALPAAAMLGIGQTSGILATQVLVGQEAPGAIRGAVVGMVGFFGAVGILAISWVGGRAFDNWMPGAPFLIMAVANAVLLLYAVFVRVRAPGPSIAG
ncbi:MAG: MFS transporter [Steroidobacteraceae bacterium]|nr:MFS transporter [Steroidobacteraceae bacterium]MDW8260558.1 MFS transporter [Gammaproteobacteria bacterium]